MWCTKLTSTAISDLLEIEKYQVCRFVRKLTKKIREYHDKAPIVKIGGPGIVVEIDESKFGKVKYHRGHRVEGVWVFGMVEKTPERRLVLVKIENRTRETLEALLVKYVHPESIIHSDCWRAYSHLSSLFTDHQSVNHSQNFSDPATGTNTNTIEGNWSGVKKQVEYTQRTKKTIDYYLIRYMFQRNFKENMFLEVLKILLAR